MKFQEAINRYSGNSNNKEIQARYDSVRTHRKSKVIILDDDPTGIQTVHGVNVYNSWDPLIISEIIENEEVAFIQTNSRSLDTMKAKQLTKEIVKELLNKAKAKDCRVEIISRSDSTLRGHYPVETEMIRDMYEEVLGEKNDGEILVPFFEEGGRFTLEDIHYVKNGDELIPAAKTEFANDPDFAYKSSDLKEYIEEKTRGKFKAVDVKSVSLEMLRSIDITEIVEILQNCTNFSKVIVNAFCYNDLKVFVTALKSKKLEKKNFIYRTSASFVKTYCHVPDKQLLNSEFFIEVNKRILRGNLFVVGSYTQKTTGQLIDLLKYEDCIPIELDVNKIIKKQKLGEKEMALKIDELLLSGKTPVVYTSRKFITKDNHLLIGKWVSDALVSIVKQISVCPRVLVTKGGITSSEIISKGIDVRKAKIAGQILPGVPVIVSGENAKWCKLPCVIFPGNVGELNALSVVLKIISNSQGHDPKIVD